jgi:hypothetical protein
MTKSPATSTRNKTAAVVKPPIRVSENTKLALMMNSDPIVPQFDPKQVGSVGSYLATLHKANEALDHRSHKFLHRLLVAGYSAAKFLQKDNAAWRDFCLDAYWKDKRQGPKPKQMKSILRHCLKRVFGVGSKKASYWAGQLKNEFESGASPTQVEQLLKRKPEPVLHHKKQTAHPSKMITVSERKKRYNRSFQVGLFEGGQTAAFKVKMASGVCAKVSIKVEYVESRANPTNPIRLTAQKMLRGEYQRPQYLEDLIAKFKARKVLEIDIEGDPDA